jgi:hypothetical protein
VKFLSSAILQKKAAYLRRLNDEPPMKYRRLSLEELSELESEFVHFLATQSITGKDWEALKKDDPLKAESLLEVFSDLVFDRILKKVSLLEMRTKDQIRLFKFYEDHVLMLGLHTKEGSTIDFREVNTELNLSESIHKVQLMRAEKKYRKEKAEEIFALLDSGCLIQRDETLFNTLFELLKKESQ